MPEFLENNQPTTHKSKVGLGSAELLIPTEAIKGASTLSVQMVGPFSHRIAHLSKSSVLTSERPIILKKKKNWQDLAGT